MKLRSLLAGVAAWAILGAPTVFFEGGMAVVTGMPGFGNTT